MARRHSAKNTIDPGPVTLDDNELQTLTNICKHWNLAKHADTPEWNVQTALAELARCGLQAVQADYAAIPRTPTHTAPPTKTTPPLDTEPQTD